MVRSAFLTIAPPHVPHAHKQATTCRRVPPAAAVVVVVVYKSRVRTEQREAERERRAAVVGNQKESLAMAFRSFAMCALVASLCVVPQTRAKVFARCDLAKTLHAMGVESFGKASLGDWMCLAFAESSYNTAATHPNPNGSTDYGIFQINSKWWCDNGTKGHNACKIKCSELLGSDITESVTCAKLVLKEQGLEAWDGWKAKCRGKDLSAYVQGCKLSP
uniref:lysozyme n=1 Tax=Petromyzon marinus TaxID=7757 RepID=A0AAJ7U3Y4_PETMA|nr:lysozyme C-1/C-2-like [Petromyzon marinus]